MNVPTNDPLLQGKDDSGFFTPYSEFAKSLRTWFIAYGIGAPAFVLSNVAVSAKVVASGHARAVAGLFLIGVSLQILQALLYKAAMWQLYAGELDSKRKSLHVYKFAETISNSFWLEMIFDLGTLIFLGWPTILLMSTLLP